MDAMQDTFTSGTVADALIEGYGVNRELINLWAHRGILDRLFLQSEAPTRGVPRRYTVRDALALAIVGRLSRLGISSERSAGWVGMAMTDLARHPGSIKTLVWLDHGDDGDELRYDATGADKALLALRINLDPIMKDVKRRLARASA